VHRAIAGARFFDQRWEFLAAILLGVLAFLWVTGGGVLWPASIDWLMVGDDGATHYLGWEFFRRSPLLQWPLGANPRYGLEISSSIVFTDSIPLLALLFKPFDEFLPETFQYHGIWLLTCFVLQAYFACRLLARVTPDPLLRLLGAGFLVTAPIFFFCIWLSHYAGAGHWLLLAALCLYLSEHFRSRSWLLLIAVAPLVNAYLFVMAGGTYAADLVQRSWKREVRLGPVIGHAVGAGLLVLLLLWAAGFFMASKYTAGQGFGLYRMNLMAPFNPMGEWSRLLPTLPALEGQFEGFAYLGLGGIALALCIPFLLLGSGLARSSVRTWLPLVVLGVCSALFSLSNRVAAGNMELFEIELPSRLWPLLGTFRASGRMVWLAWYLLVFAGLAAVLLRCHRRSALAILASLLILQTVDISQGLLDIRSQLTKAPKWESPMKSEFWHAAARKYEEVRVVLPQKHFSDYQAVAEFALSSGMETNGVYLARVDQEKLRLSQALTRLQVETGTYLPSAVYIFGDEDLWAASLQSKRATDFRGVVDGFRVLAPRFAE
jgi:hypothetical protein